LKSNSITLASVAVATSTILIHTTTDGALHLKTIHRSLESSR